jgi:hypothetical protein
MQQQPEYLPPEQEEYLEPQVPNYETSALAQEYDRLQKKAEAYQQEIKAIESTNPHSLYKDIITKPTSKGKFPVTIMGRPLDLAKLENYLVYRISPKTVTTLMRYNDSLVRAETLGFLKRKPIKMKSGILWIILGAAIIVILGYILLTTDMSSLFKGMFGMG